MILGIFQNVFRTGNSWSHGSSDTDLSHIYSYGFYNSTITGHDESKVDHKRDENWNVSFDVVNGRAVRETDGDITIIIDESSKYSKSGESHESSETTQNATSDNYYCNYILGTRTTHFKRDANVSDSSEQSYYEKITADWSNHANEQGNLEYKISADSEITVKAKGDYSSYLYEYSDNEFDGCRHYSSEYYCDYGCGCGYYCYYSSSGNSLLHTYSENERTIDVSEHYDSELHENRHTDGGVFYRVSFDGFANGDGSSSNLTHQDSEYDYHHDWDSDSYGCHSWGSVDNYNDSTSDTSGSTSP